MFASVGDCIQGTSLEHFGPVVLPVTQDGHAELGAMPALLILFLALRMHIGFIPACREAAELPSEKMLAWAPIWSHACSYSTKVWLGIVGVQEGSQ